VVEQQPKYNVMQLMHNFQGYLIYSSSLR